MFPVICVPQSLCSWERGEWGFGNIGTWEYLQGTWGLWNIETREKMGWGNVSKIETGRYKNCGIWTDRGNITTRKHQGVNLCMRSANERLRYIVTPFLIGWAHAQNYPWTWIGDMEIAEHGEPSFIRRGILGVGNIGLTRLHLSERQCLPGVYQLGGSQMAACDIVLYK